MTSYSKSFHSFGLLGQKDLARFLKFRSKLIIKTGLNQYKLHSLQPYGYIFLYSKKWWLYPVCPAGEDPASNPSYA